MWRGVLSTHVPWHSDGLVTKANSETHSIQRFDVMLVALLLCIVVFQLLPLDMWLQDQLYDEGMGRWLWNGDEPISRLLLYDGVKAALAIFWASVGVGLILSRWVAPLWPYRRGLRIVFASLILVPLSVAALKVGTNIACPRDLAAYGGDVEYVGILPMYSPDGVPSSRQKCFPASHASSGFALFSLFFLFRSKVYRRRALYLGLVVGGICGAYKIAIGDHFLSHTIVSMVLAWLIANVVARVDKSLYRDLPQRGALERCSGAPSSQEKLRALESLSTVRS